MPMRLQEKGNTIDGLKKIRLVTAEQEKELKNMLNPPKK